MPSVALERHTDTPCGALRGITVSIERKSESLQVVYALEGEIARLRIPPPRPPRVAERLWQHTCCEIFVARRGAPGYREFNLSPSGEWAAYSFQRYREGGPLAIVAPRIEVQQSGRKLRLAASIPVEEPALRIGASAVIEDDGGALSYWALRHPPGKPDFHHPDAFALELD